MPEPRRAAWPGEVRTRRWCRADTSTSGGLIGPAAAEPTALRDREVCSGGRGQQEFLQGRARSPLQALPVLQGHKHRRDGTALRYDLRPLIQTRLDELAEPRLGVLDRPTFHRGNASALLQTSQGTSLLLASSQVSDREGGLSAVTSDQR